MSDLIDLELLQPSVCMAAGKSVTVMLRVSNPGDEAVDVVLEVRGRLAALALVEPAGLRLEPGEARVGRITFQPGHGPYAPSGPLPYAISVRSLTSDEPLDAAFGLVDVHRQRSRRPVGAAGPAAPCVRIA